MMDEYDALWESPTEKKRRNNAIGWPSYQFPPFRMIGGSINMAQ